MHQTWAGMYICDEGDRMTNREKWFMAMTDQSVVDINVEDFICKSFVTPTLGEACPGCPLGSLCRSYVNEERTFEQYMAAVTEWLDKET